MVKKMYLYLAVAILVIVGALAYINMPKSGVNGYLLSFIGKPVSQQVLAGLNVPNSISNRLGAGAASGFPTRVNASPLTNGTKPVVLYIGANYCPYCAVTRWGLIMALMRFGTFSNLHYMVSNSTDVFPNTPTFTFYNSTYSSSYISFAAVETQGYNEKPLQQMTSAQSSIFSKYNPGGGIPFIDFGNVSVQSGASVSPQVLAGMNWNSTIANLTNTNSSVSEALVGSADVFTAQICRMTNMNPSSVCSQPYVSSILRSYG